MTLPIRKIQFGVADRRQMYRLFDRHAQRPDRWQTDGSALYAGEWFEIARTEYDHMLEILPPLWMRDSMFAMREFLTGSVTSVFFALRVNGVMRHFHGYCDLSDPRSANRMHATILERESHPVKAMTRQERIEHIWSATYDEYRGYAGADFRPQHRGKRTIIVYANRSSSFQLLDHLTDAQILEKLPVQLRFLSVPETV
ncbi:MAG: DUF1419 domain-containing protein [Ahrensia sp.]